MRYTGLRRGVLHLLALTGLLLGAGASVAVAAASHGRTARRRAQPRAQRRAHASGAPSTCTGTFEAPGVLAGVYAGSVSVEGVCDVDGGPAKVTGNLTVDPGATLVAAYALDDRTDTGESSLTVTGNVLVQTGATAVLGCQVRGGSYFPCLDSPELASPVHIEGGLKAKKALGVVMHDAEVRRSFTMSGGGGGVSCDEPSELGPGIFATLGYPVYSAIELSTIRGSVAVNGLRSCWLGVNRDVVGGSVKIDNDDLDDPDAIEILANEITHNLTCKNDSDTWDSIDYTGALWPRLPEPNTVGGKRSGQCVLSSPPVEGGERGPGPF